jgi:Ankyrin repeats (many copies)
MSNNGMTPPTNRTPDALVDRYREASAQLNETPNPRVRSAVLANAAQVAREANTPKHNPVLTKKRAANDGMWRYAAAASVMVAGVAAFIINQWQSGDAELVVSDASVAAASAPSTNAPAATSATAPIAVESSTDAARAASAPSTKETGASETPMVLARESAGVNATASAQSVTLEKKSASVAQAPSSRSAGETRREQSGDVAVAAASASREPIAVEPASPSVYASNPAGSSERVVPGDTRRGEPVASAARAPSAPTAMSAPAPMPAPAAQASIATATRSDATSDGIASSTNALPQRKSTAQVVAPATPATAPAAPAASAAEAPPMTMSRERSAPSAPVPSARVGEVNESMRRGIDSMRANGTLRQGVRDGDVAAVRNALAAGADSNLTNNNGSTMLSIAVQQNSLGVVTELLRAGADPTRRDSAGLSALDYAERNGNREIINALRR